MKPLLSTALLLLGSLAAPGGQAYASCDTWLDVLCDYEDDSGRTHRAPSS